MGIDRMLSFGFSAKLRLLQAAEFKNVFDAALYKVHQSGFMLLALPAAVLKNLPESSLVEINPSAVTSGLDHPRLGLVIAKKKIRRAHERNRVKRLARESFRLHQAELPALDIILMAKADAQTLSNEVLHQQLNDAWRQLSKRFAKNQTIIPNAHPAKNATQASKRGSLDKKNTPRAIDLVSSDPSNSLTPAATPE